MAHVRIISTGGTIASTSSGGDAGKTPSVTGPELVEAVPEIAASASIDVEDVCQVSGFQMDFEHANQMLDAIERATDEGADGVVVTHGTDTMAESAYYCSLVAATEIPIVFTGAQRSFDQLGADGPSNLVTAVDAAGNDQFRATGGSYLAFNDTVHDARWVVKSHTSRLETFQSPDVGPIAERTPDGLGLVRDPQPSTPFPGARIDPAVRVELVTNAMGIDGRQVERARDAVDAFVVAGTGLGNTTGELGATLEAAIDSGLPVVLTSRCHAGTTAGQYGGPGGAKTLLDGGAIAAGYLPPWKGRLVAALALSGGDADSAEPIDRVQSAFEAL